VAQSLPWSAAEKIKTDRIHWQQATTHWNKTGETG